MMSERDIHLIGKSAQRTARPKLSPIGDHASIERHALTYEEGMNCARLIARDATRQMLACGFDEEERGQSSVHHQGGVTLDIARIRQVIVYAMGIESKRRIAEQKNGIGSDGVRPFGLSGV